ncbi:ATP synthase gamma chain [Bienertia sinuspersici]
MATEQKAESTEQINGSNPTVGFVGKVEAKYHDLKDHAETYPYVWASYMVVYGGFGLWFAYRWRKLRRTEDRVRGLQERLRKLAQAEELASKISSKPTNVDKPPQ